MRMVLSGTLTVHEDWLDAHKRRGILSTDEN